MLSYALLKWRVTRWRLDTRERFGEFLKVQDKLINILRRLVIAISAIWLRKYRREKPLELDEISSVLFIPNDPIGDLLLTSTLWHILKARKPDLRVGVMASPRNKSLLRNDGEVTYEYDLFAHNIFERIREVLRARRDRWDVVLTTGGFFKPVRYALLMRFIARDMITASQHDSREERLHNIYSYCFKREKYPFPVPMIEQFQSLLARLFSITIRPEERIPKYAPRPEVVQDVQQRVGAIRDSLGTPYLVQLHLEAKRSTLEWEFENVKSFAKLLLDERQDVAILLTASPMFLSRYPEYAAMQIDRCMIFSTRSMEELAALVGLVELVITPDTAVVHFAALVHAPLIILFEKETEWLPYKTDYTMFTSGMKVPVRFIPIEPVLTATLKLLDKG